MTFKEELENDIEKTFLNIDEFGEEHTVDGRNIICMFDDDRLTARQGSNELAVSDSSVLLFAHVKDLPKRKVASEKLIIDGKVYVVDDWKVNFKMAEIVLHRGESRGGN